MPKISWKKVRERAARFANEWDDIASEKRDKQKFWNGFFNVFGIPRRVVAFCESSIKEERGTYDSLQLFWPGLLLVEHKPCGASWLEADSQAFVYIKFIVHVVRHVGF